MGECAPNRHIKTIIVDILYGNMDNNTLYNKTNKLVSNEDIVSIIKKYDIKLKPRNISMYRKAFIHKSYCVRKNENVVIGNKNCPKECVPLQEESNERLEFLGDAVINLAVAYYLFKRYPDENEGFLTKMRTKLVNGTMLAHLSRIAGFGDRLVLSQHVDDNKGRDNTKLLEDGFEAFIGAMFDDFNSVKIKTDKLGSGSTGIGYQVAEQWLMGIIEDNIDFSDLISHQDNHKERLIRFMQSQFGVHPKFVVVCDNENAVTIVVKKNNEVIATASAENRKAAEKLGAIGALKYYGIVDNLKNDAAGK